MRWVIVIFTVLLATSANAAVVGYQDTTSGITDLHNISDTIRGPKYTSDATGYLDTLYAYLFTPGHRMRGAVYRDADDSRLDTTEEIATATSGRQWVAFPFVGHQQIKTDTVYYFVVWANDSAGAPSDAKISFYYQFLSTPIKTQDPETYGTWPATGTFADGSWYKVYIYVTTTDTPPSTGPPNYIHGPGEVGCRHSPSGRSEIHEP